MITNFKTLYFIPTYHKYYKLLNKNIRTFLNILNIRTILNIFNIVINIKL